jgi:hypothetical protein
MRLGIMMRSKGAVFCVLMTSLSAGMAVAGQIDPEDLALDAALAAAEAGCAPAIVDLTAEGPGQVGVTLLAPCYAGEMVTIDHGGLILTSALSSGGSLYVSMPVLEPDAAVTVTFQGGLMADATMPESRALQDVQEVAAQW